MSKDNAEKKLSSLLNMDLEALIIFLKKRNLSADEILQSLSEANFNSNVIPYLFSYDLNLFFNPFIYLLTEMKDSIKNMQNNFQYFEKYNLKGEVLRFYYGVANMANKYSRMFKLELTELLKNFDEKLASYNADNNKSEHDQFIKELNNVMNFLKDNKTVDPDIIRLDNKDYLIYLRKAVNIAFMHIFLRVASANKETSKKLNNFELNLLSDFKDAKEIKFSEFMTLRSKVVLDKMVEIMLDDYDFYKDVVRDLYEGIVLEVDLEKSAYMLELFENMKENKEKLNKKIEADEKRDKQKSKVIPFNKINK